jgi:hypothetical protein
MMDSEGVLLLSWAMVEGLEVAFLSLWERV